MAYEKIDYQPQPEEKKKYWNIAVGLQAIDYLKPSEYLHELAEKNVAGALTNRQVEELLYTRYEKETPEEKAARVKECDIVSNRIVELLEREGMPLNPGSLKSIHKYLFHDIYPDAGRYREYNIRKCEPVLNGETVKYANYYDIEELLSYDFEQEKKRKYQKMEPEKVVKHISEFTSSIWQVHPFSEGNTRTTAVFIERYLNYLGFQVNNELFSENSLYFRNALVRSNYADYKNGIVNTDKFLHLFFENLLYGVQNHLSLREEILQEMFQEPEL